jgi:hypothetical protein
VIIHNEEPVAVAANSGVDSPLDKRDNLPCGAQGCPVNARSPETQRPTAPSEHMNKRSEGEKSATIGHARKTVQTDQFHSQIVASSAYMTLPCDRCDSKSRLADPSALRTTPEARFGSKNCTTTAGAELHCRSRPKFAEPSRSQAVTVPRAGTPLQPAENEPNCDAVTQVTHGNGTRSRASERRERTQL